MNKRFFISMVFAVLCSPFSVWAQSQYQLNIDRPEHHLAEVKATFTLPSNTKIITLQLPAWRTGRYEILNLANGIRSLSVNDRTGAALPWQKIDKSTWQIAVNNRKQIFVSYEIYANQLAKRSRHIDDTHAFIDASGYFLYSELLRDKPVSVSLTMPPLWDSISGMASGKQPHSYLAENYDVLVDSPIEAGLFERLAFKAEGIDFELAIWGEGNYDSQQMVIDLTKMVKQANSIWQGTPFKRYVFMVHATTDARGATEHLNSTIIQRKRFTFAPRDQYLQFLATAAHEYVHTWNVKTYRPKGLTPYDYQSENYTKLLWIAEGSTSYLEYQLLLRAGLITAEEYFKELAKEFYEHDRTPGKYQQSLAHASLDKWIAEGGDRNTNSQVSIYDEGALLSLLLDLKIINESKAKISYRDLHNELYQQYALPKGYTSKDVKTLLQKLTGNDYSQWWQTHVESPIALDFSAVLASVGLSLESDAMGYDIGVKFVIVDNLTEIKVVEKNSPAWLAGMTAGDTILAIDGLRLHAGKLEDRLREANQQETIKLLLFRGDRVIERVVKMPKEQPTSYKVVKVSKANKSQKRNYKKWLGLDFDEKK